MKVIPRKNSALTIRAQVHRRFDIRGFVVGVHGHNIPVDIVHGIAVRVEIESEIEGFPVFRRPIRFLHECTARKAFFTPRACQTKSMLFQQSERAVSKLTACICI